MTPLYDNQSSVSNSRSNMPRTSPLNPPSTHSLPSKSGANENNNNDAKHNITSMYTPTQSRHSNQTRNFAAEAATIAQKTVSNTKSNTPPVISILDTLSNDEDDDKTKSSSSLKQQEEKETQEESQQQEALPPLNLPKREILSGFPCEKDRKRIIGCLAAILASSYHEESRCCTDASSASTTTVALDHQTVNTTSTTEDDTGSSTNLDKLSMQRHLKRRHEIHVELLECATKLLFLGDGVAMGFIPMLQVLLRYNHDNTNIMSPSAGSFTSVNSGTSPSSTVYSTPSSYTLNDLNSLNGNYSTGTPIDDSPPVRKSLFSLYSPSINTTSITDASSIIAGIEDDSPKNHASAIISNMTTPNSTKKNNIFFATDHSPQEPKKDPQSMATLSSSRNDEATLMQPFLESLTPQSAYPCIAMLLLHYLLRGSPNGYDARVRHAFKRLAVVLFVHEEICVENFLNNRVEQDVRKHLEKNATRKFEALERAIATKIVNLKNVEDVPQDLPTMNQREDYTRTPAKDARTSSFTSTPKSLSRESLLRTIKITSAGIAAGTLFALSGGLAAPGIAAGVATIGAATTATVTSSICTAVITGLSSTAAVSTIFGVGGGGLAAYKVSRRMRGLKEFEFKRECGPAGMTCVGKGESHAQLKPRPEVEPRPELFTVVCLSGWLTDKHDFRRPWGVCVSKPNKLATLWHRKQHSLKRKEGVILGAMSPSTSQDYATLLSRLTNFYYIYNPENVSRAPTLLSQWRGEEDELWNVLRDKYGIDPTQLHDQNLRESKTIYREYQRNAYEAFRRNTDHQTTPNTPSTRKETTTPSLDCTPPAALTVQEDGVLNMLLEELGYECMQSEHTQLGPRKMKTQNTPAPAHHRSPQCSSTTRLPNNTNATHINIDHCDITPCKSHHSTSTALTAASTPAVPFFTSTEKKKTPFSNSAASTAQNPNQKVEWDYHTFYTGELYTVKWESRLLMELCDSVTDLAVDAIGSATTQILKTTALHSLLSAITLPYALVNAANMIDGTWTLAIERSDQAGVELAKSLMESQAGFRPVVLMGFGMGARTIYSCLKELCRMQDKWEEERDSQHQTNIKLSREPASIVEDAILMGCPNHLSITSWKAARRIVAGRLVNCYSRKDLVLSLMFQYKRMTGMYKKVCGTTEVEVNGVENYDVTDLVSSHADYCSVVKDVLKVVGYGQPIARGGGQCGASGEEDDRVCEGGG